MMKQEIFNLMCLGDELESYYNTDYRTAIDSLSTIRRILEIDTSSVELVKGSILEEVEDAENSVIRMSDAFDKLKTGTDDLYQKHVEERERQKEVAELVGQLDDDAVEKMIYFIKLLAQLDDEKKDMTIAYLNRLQGIPDISERSQSPDRKDGTRV